MLSKNVNNSASIIADIQKRLGGTTTDSENCQLVMKTIFNNCLAKNSMIEVLYDDTGDSTLYSIVIKCLRDVRSVNITELVSNLETFGCINSALVGINLYPEAPKYNTQSNFLNLICLSLCIHKCNTPGLSFGIPHDPVKIMHTSRLGEEKIKKYNLSPIEQRFCSSVMAILNNLAIDQPMTIWHISIDNHDSTLTLIADNIVSINLIHLKSLWDEYPELIDSIYYGYDVGSLKPLPSINIVCKRTRQAASVPKNRNRDRD